MKILVGLKYVPDTEAKVKVAANGTTLDPAGVKMIASPYDDFALEEGVKLKEAAGSGEVVVVCAGPEAAGAVLREGLAKGADRAILVKDLPEGADGFARASVLAGVARRESPDLILLGKYGVGTDDGQTGPMLAELLDLPHAGAVVALTVEGGKLSARREVEGLVEVLEGALPAVITCDKGLNVPRYANIKGIMAAKKKPVETVSATELGAALQERVVWESLELPPPRQAGKILKGDPADTSRELARLLREEAKVL
jgi:electron transfer flavoprotein beta subunit